MPSADIISAVEFDHDGLHLATGDRGGRVVLFERVNPNAVSRGASDELCVSHPGFAAGYIHRTSSLFIALHAFDIMLIVSCARWRLQRAVGMDQRQPPPFPRGAAFEYRYMTEFQSHEPEFDYLKSLEIEEKINKVRWCRSSSNTRMLLSTNDKTVKLWKVSLHG